MISQKMEIKAVNVTALAVDPIEKKPFRHFLPGTKTLSYGSLGKCSLDCFFCENKEISGSKKPKFITMDMVSFFSHASVHKCQSVCATYTEPLSAYNQTFEVAKACRSMGFKFLLKTNAHIGNRDKWLALLEYVDAINIDWKGDEDSFKLATGAKRYYLGDRLKDALGSSTHVEISIPLYYRLSNEMKNSMDCLIRLLSDKKDIPCHLLKINPAYKCSYSTSEDMISSAERFLKSAGQNNIYVSQF